MSTAFRSELTRWRRYSTLLCTCMTITMAESLATRSNTSRFAIFCCLFAASMAARISDRFPLMCETRESWFVGWDVLVWFRRLAFAIWCKSRERSRCIKLPLAPTEKLWTAESSFCWMRASTALTMALADTSSSRSRMLTSTTMKPIADMMKTAFMARFGVTSGMITVNLQQRNSATKMGHKTKVKCNSNNGNMQNISMNGERGYWLAIPQWVLYKLAVTLHPFCGFRFLIMWISIISTGSFCGFSYFYGGFRFLVMRILWISIISRTAQLGQ